MTVREMIGMIDDNEEYEIGLYKYFTSIGKSKWKTLYKGTGKNNVPSEFLDKPLKFVSHTDHWKKPLKQYKLIFGLN